MGIMDAVKKGFGVAAKGMGLVLVLFIFNLVANLAAMPFAVAPGTTPSPQATTGALVFTALFILLSVFFQGATLGMVRDVLKEGKLKLAAFANYGLKYYLRLLLLGLLIIAIVAIVALVAGLIIAATTPLNNAIVSTIAAIVAIVIGIGALLWFFVPLMLAPYALVCEDIGAVEAIKKSLKIGKNPFSRVFMLILLIIVLILISLGASLVIGFLVGLISAVVPVNVGQIIMSVATSAINGYFGVVITAAFMAYYFVISGAGKGTEKVF